MSVTGLASHVVSDSSPAYDAAADFDAVFERYSRSIYRYVVVRVGDAHLADDLMQQLWLQARSSSTAVPKDELEFWLRGIARNLVRTHWRRQARRPKDIPLADPAVAQELADRLGTAELPPDLLERREVCDQLLLAITELASEEQELIVGHYFHGRPHEELAGECGLSARAIEGRLYRSRRALREKLRHLNGQLGSATAEGAGVGGSPVPQVASREA
jgi:RNA polymerase sigma-70 factor (ECF subfamily)